MNFEAPLTIAGLAHLDRLGGAHLRRRPSCSSADLGDGTLWWKLSTIITCGTLAGAIIPELVKVFTSTESAHVREVVTSSREGGASLNILSGLVAGNFSAYWLGLIMVVLMGIAYCVSTTGPGRAHGRPRGLRLRPGGLRLPRHGAGDHRRRLLRPGHRQRPVGLRALGHRDAARHQAGASRRTSASTWTSRRPSTSSRRTTGRATPSRPRPSRC